MDREAILVQLQAIRGICDALAAQIVAESAPAGGCEHPEDQRQDVSTMRGPRKFFCRACRQTVEVGG
jgi:DNA-binding FrmR family transcriptional regulator